MIQDINISYIVDGIEVNLSIPQGEIAENLPYNLANMFSRLVKDTNANPALVIKVVFADGTPFGIEVKE